MHVLIWPCLYLSTPCPALPCERLPIPLNGYLHPPVCMLPRVPFRTRCLIKCHHGFTRKGQRAAKCKANMRWSGRVRQEPTVCEKPGESGGSAKARGEPRKRKWGSSIGPRYRSGDLGRSNAKSNVQTNGTTTSTDKQDGKPRVDSNGTAGNKTTSGSSNTSKGITKVVSRNNKSNGEDGTKSWRASQGKSNGKSWKGRSGSKTTRSPDTTPKSKSGNSSSGKTSARSGKGKWTGRSKSNKKWSGRSKSNKKWSGRSKSSKWSGRSKSSKGSGRSRSSNKWSGRFRNWRSGNRRGTSRKFGQKITNDKVGTVNKKNDTSTAIEKKDKNNGTSTPIDKMSVKKNDTSTATDKKSDKKNYTTTTDKKSDKKNDTSIAIDKKVEPVTS